MALGPLMEQLEKSQRKTPFWEIETDVSQKMQHWNKHGGAKAEAETAAEMINCRSAGRVRTSNANNVVAVGWQQKKNEFKSIKNKIHTSRWLRHIQRALLAAPSPPGRGKTNEQCLHVCGPKPEAASGKWQVAGGSTRTSTWASSSDSSERSV